MQQIQSPTFRLRVATPEKKIIPIKEAPSTQKSDAPLSLSYKENKEAKALAMLEYRNLLDAWKRFRLQTEGNKIVQSDTKVNRILLQLDEAIASTKKELFSQKTDKWFISLSDDEKTNIISKRSSTLFALMEKEYEH